MKTSFDMSQCRLVIPAIKKNVAFADDLIKKLDGVMLIQRAVDKARDFMALEDIMVLTDSDEISVICERNKVPYHYDRNLKLNESDPLQGLNQYFASFAKDKNYLIVLWPYAPLVSVEEIRAAFLNFVEKGNDGMISVKGTRHQFVMTDKGLNITDGDTAKKNYYLEVKAFSFMRPQEVLNKKNASWYPYELKENRMEIKDYHDWWVCERLLKRKRIIFRVIGYDRVGLGHVYRALSLAHENTHDEILFICGDESTIAVNKIAGHDYPLEVLPKDKLENRIIELKPDMVINDILDTDSKYVRRLKAAGIKVVNFEDLGSGASEADLTFNDIYQTPMVAGDNILWGYKYHFLRDEFINARVHSYEDKAEDVLLTFGGTDPGDLTMNILTCIDKFCLENKIRIHIVTGSGYAHSDKVMEYARNAGNGRISFTNQTGVISHIMEKTPIAICGNGRTVFELAHMHIPAIVIAQNEREKSHIFACEENGFINVGLFSKGNSEKRINDCLMMLCRDNSNRRKMFERTLPFNFLSNKKRVLDLIETLLHSNKEVNIAEEK